MLNDFTVTAGFSMHQLGRLDGMNEEGLTIGIHYVNGVSKKDGFLGTTIVRMVLDLCSTVSEAVELVKNIPHAYAFNYSLTDKTGQKAVIEASPQRIAIREAMDENMTCTNHFQASEMAHEYILHLQHSLDRDHYLRELGNSALSPEEMFHEFTHAGSPLCFAHYKRFFGTLHTFMALPKELKILVGIGRNAKPTVIDVGSWVKTSDFVMKELHGTLSV
jgi:predicted choloylglycine hydrolase